MMKDFLDPDLLKKSEEVKKEEERKQRELEEDIRLEMSTEYGRRNVFRLLEEAKVYSCTFTGNSQTFFLEGRRDIGLWKLGQIMKVCPDKYILMIQEAYYKQIKESEVKNAKR